MPLNSDGCLVDQTPMSTQSLDIDSHAPPLYGEHVLDQLYADIDQSGIMTPQPQSGMNTPFHGLSRHNSSDNLASLNDAMHPSGAVAPAALTNRLQNLSSTHRNSSFLRNHHHLSSGGNTPHPISASADGSYDYFDTAMAAAAGSTPQSVSNPLSRRTSEEDHPVGSLMSGTHTPEHIDYSDLGDLTKVPSYSTAVRAPIRGISFSDATTLPNYEAAVSTPNSPSSFPSTPGTETPTSAGAAVAAARRSFMASVNGGAGVNSMAPNLRPLQMPLPAHIGDDDERRRLHFLRNRERAH